MAISTDQYERLLNRITAIENLLNDVLTAQENFVTMSQVNQVLTIVQQDVADVRETAATLQERVEAIESEPLT